MGYFIARDPRGCDVARKAMWKSHTDPRKHGGGAEMACTRGSVRACE